MSIIKYFLVISYLIGSTLLANATDQGTRQDALALMAKARQIVKQRGEQALVDAINKGKYNLRYKDLYLYATYADERAGLNIAHATNPKLVGRKLLNLRDQNGKYFVREYVALARQQGSGWVDYRWQNPTTKKMEDKSTYSEVMGNIIVSVGIYRSSKPNANTVGIISGNPSSSATYLQIAQDLAEVLNDSDELRVVPVIGIGGVQNIRDVRLLKGIDIGLTQSNILNAYKTNNTTTAVSETENEKIVYIANLFKEEFHIIARKEFSSLQELNGQKVNIDKIGSGTAFAMRDIFVKYGISVHEINVSQVDAIEKMKKGEIAATVLVAGKPVKSLFNLNLQDQFHFIPIEFKQSLVRDYLPTILRHKDYPTLIPEGQSINTLAVSTVLISYNWPKNSDRYRRVSNFVNKLFGKINEFRKAPRHPKWREVNLAATLPGWDRFDAAETQLSSNSDNQREKFASFLRASGATSQNSEETKRLFQNFLRWQRANSQ